MTVSNFENIYAQLPPDDRPADICTPSQAEEFDATITFVSALLKSMDSAQRPGFMWSGIVLASELPGAIQSHLSGQGYGTLWNYELGPAFSSARGQDDGAPYAEPYPVPAIFSVQPLGQPVGEVSEISYKVSTETSTGLPTIQRSGPDGVHETGFNEATELIACISAIGAAAVAVHNT